MSEKNRIERAAAGQYKARIVKCLFYVWLVLLVVNELHAQQIKIGDNYTRLDSSAALEIESQKFSLLLPRIGDTGKVVTTVKDGSLLYYQPAGGLNKGLYLRSAAKWELVPSSGNIWLISGNAGTVGNQHFVGTTDNRPLLLKTNNITRAFIDSTSGYVGIGTTTPSGTLDNRGATILGARMMTSFSSGTNSLGASVNTVDSFTTFIIPQTTSGLTITLPTPSKNTDGRIITIANTGTVSFMVAGLTLEVNNAVSFIWAQSQWRMVADGTANGSFNVPNKYIAPSTLGLMSGAAANTIAQDNIAIGTNALNENITGSRNIAIGGSALRYGKTSFANVAIGAEALTYASSGNRNVAIGHKALYVNTADSNFAIGAFSLTSNTTGKGNTAVGNNALKSNVTGSGNTAVGAYSMVSADAAASFNTALGRYTARVVNSSYNTVGGPGTLYRLKSGVDYITTWGASAGDHDGVTYSDTSNVKNATAIGVGSQFRASNVIILGSEGAAYVSNVGVGIYNPTYKLHVNGVLAGQGAIVTPSDRRLKKNIRPLEQSLQKILALRGVTYRWNAEAAKKVQLRTDSLVHYGFIAQEVEPILPHAVVTGADSLRIKAIEYTAIVPVIAAAIKEQQPQLESLSNSQAVADKQLNNMQRQLNFILETVNKK